VDCVVELDVLEVRGHVAAAVAEPLVGALRVFALHVFRRVRVVAAQDDCQGG